MILQKIHFLCKAEHRTAGLEKIVPIFSFSTFILHLLILLWWTLISLMVSLYRFVSSTQQCYNSNINMTLACRKEAFVSVFSELSLHCILLTIDEHNFPWGHVKNQKLSYLCASGGNKQFMLIAVVISWKPLICTVGQTWIETGLIQRAYVSRETLHPPCQDSPFDLAVNAPLSTAALRCYVKFGHDVVMCRF